MAADEPGLRDARNAREPFMRSLQFRHACRIFDEARQVSRTDLDYVMEAGRLSPSSLGLEPWRFIVIEDRMLRRRLRPSCWNQSQITTSSVLIVIVALKADLSPDSPYPRRMLRRSAASEAGLEEAMEIYREMLRGAPLSWSIAQCHIAAANMMMAAATIGIDSCPIGGFEPEAVAEVLELDRSRVEVALLIALGYRVQSPPPRQRLPLSELVEYR